MTLRVSTQQHLHSDGTMYLRPCGFFSMECKVFTNPGTLETQGPKGFGFREGFWRVFIALRALNPESLTLDPGVQTLGFRV